MWCKRDDGFQEHVCAHGAKKKKRKGGLSVSKVGTSTLGGTYFGCVHVYDLGFKAWNFISFVICLKYEHYALILSPKGGKRG